VKLAAQFLKGKNYSGLVETIEVLPTVQSENKMSQITNPPWLREESYEPLQSNNLSEIVKVDSRRSQTIFWILKASIMFLCALMAFTAVIGLG
jgi:hypothetical protein